MNTFFGSIRVHAIGEAIERFLLALVDGDGHFQFTTNAAMGAKQVRECCKLDSESRGYLEHAMEQMNFSARAHDRILKVSRTVADLAGKQDISGNEVLEAIRFRPLDRRSFE